MGTRLAAQLLKAKPEQSDRQIAKQVGRDHKTVAKVRREAERRGEIPRIALPRPVSPRGRPATMMQPCASAAKLRGSGTILSNGESQVSSLRAKVAKRARRNGGCRNFHC